MAAATDERSHTSFRGFLFFIFNPCHQHSWVGPAQANDMLIFQGKTGVALHMCFLCSSQHVGIVCQASAKTWLMNVSAGGCQNITE